MAPLIVRRIVLLLACACLAAKGVSRTAAEGISRQEYQDRRARLVSLMDSTEALVMRAAEPRLRSNDVNYRYRQESNFLYLTGLNSPGHAVIVLPRGVLVDGAKVHILLFVGPLDDDAEKPVPGANEVILDAKRFEEIFAQVVPTVQTLYVSSPDMKLTYDWLNAKPLFVERDARKQLEQKFPGLKTKSPGKFFSTMRVVKSPSEIALIQKAIDVTGDGIANALRTCRPDGYEYELQAAVEQGMIAGGAWYTGFPSIIGSGGNSLILHYDLNRRQMKQGDVVVMDVGAEYEGYSADITRTIPVSGRFTPAQKEIYTVVLRTMKEVEKAIRPGVPMRVLEQTARNVITASGYQNYIRHGVSHFVGLDVHDLGGFADTLKSGMVLTVEPGLYIPADDTLLKPAYRGFGIRIEDDVLVTEQGSNVLTRKVPREIDELEALMKKHK